MKKADKAVPLRAKTNQRKKTRKDAKKIITGQSSPVIIHKPHSPKSPKRAEFEKKRFWATLISAVGDNFLPSNDPRRSIIIRQRGKMMDRQKKGLEEKWGVTVDDAHKAVESGWSALRKFVLDSLCGGEFGGNNTSREKWIINFLKHDSIKLMERYLNDKILKSRAESRGEDFFTYVGQIADIKCGIKNTVTEINEKKTLAKWYMLMYWIEPPIPICPPVCLWTDTSIGNFLGHEKELSLASIRQLKHRLILFAPRRRYRFMPTGSVTGSLKGRFEVFRN